MKSVKVGNTVLDGSSLFVLAGPCVIEDPERTLNIGREMKKICEKLGLPYVFKASFDKANRSSFTSYRGPGLEEGLKILGHIKKEVIFMQWNRSKKRRRSWIFCKSPHSCAVRRICLKRRRQQESA